MMPSFRFTPPPDSPSLPMKISRLPSPNPLDSEESSLSDSKFKLPISGRLDKRNSLTISVIDKEDLSFEGRLSLGISIGDSNFDSSRRVSCVFGENQGRISEIRKREDDGVEIQLDSPGKF
jgi:hypothetical protein